MNEVQIGATIKEGVPLPLGDALFFYHSLYPFDPGGAF
ncbi:hypothetical protein B4113_4176 [Geobacillus sp. B4113_201601]|nr:hypothetical protein B4113_4176 [Geobacillus sp. B4113_201601]